MYFVFHAEQKNLQYVEGVIHIHTVGPVLIAWFNYCVLSFASNITSLLIVLASHEAREVML